MVVPVRFSNSFISFLLINLCPSGDTCSRNIPSEGKTLGENPQGILSITTQQSSHCTVAPGERTKTSLFTTPHFGHFRSYSGTFFSFLCRSWNSWEAAGGGATSRRGAGGWQKSFKCRVVSSIHNILVQRSKVNPRKLCKLQHHL